MSQPPPYDPYRQPARPPQHPRGQHPPRYPEDQHGYGRQPQGDPYDAPPRRDPYGAPRDPYNPAPPDSYRESVPRRASAPVREAPPRPPEPSSSGIRLPGIGLILALLGTIVQILSLTVLPWVTATHGEGTAGLATIWDALTNGGAHSFGDWYVVLFSYPLVGLGVLLAFAAVLESVAAKVVWAILAVLGLGFLVLRYGFGPLAGVFGSKSAMHFSTVEIVVAVVALVLLLIVAFTLKMAVSMFRRVAGVILIVLAGVHIAAVVDLVKSADLTQLSVGAFGPTVGYLLIGIAALIGPRRLLPG